MQSVKTSEVEITSIHDDIGPGLRYEDIRHIDVVDFSIRDVDKDRDGALEVDHRVELDRSLGAPESGPREEREAKVDGGCIQRINGCIEVCVRGLFQRKGGEQYE